MILEIKDMPENTRNVPILHFSKMRVKSLPLKQSPNLSNLWKMVKACLSDDGIGLAAPQIGIYERMFLIREQGEDNTFKDSFRVFLNPSFKATEPTKELGMEACLSVPGVAKNVLRYTSIEAIWFEATEAGTLEPKSEIFTGLKARVFQHELDHLNLVSILDR